MIGGYGPTTGFLTYLESPTSIRPWSLPESIQTVGKPIKGSVQLQYSFTNHKRKNTPKKPQVTLAMMNADQTLIIFDTRIITKSAKNFRTVVAYLQRTAIHVF